MICKSVPMAARAPHSGAACRAWPQRQRKALWPSIAVSWKAGTTLVRQWRGHTHTVLVQKDGFEHEGQRYRSLTVIAERITGAHWSGPRFFGLTKQAHAALPAEPCR
jgi:hypothetical protein